MSSYQEQPQQRQQQQHQQQRNQQQHQQSQQNQHQQHPHQHHPHQQHPHQQHPHQHHQHQHQPYVTIHSRQPAHGNATTNGDSPAAMGASGSCPRSATHDIGRTSFHMKHMDQFVRRLEDSATRAFPNRGRASQRYSKVQALLLHWESDDLFVLPELEDLKNCLRHEYSFDTDVFPIPSENSHLELMLRLGELVKDHESRDTLFIIYYGGHARIDDSRQSTWCATRDPDSPWLQWSAIQTLLERSKSDVLILLDCCAGAASATFPHGNSTTETISASSWDAIAPDPGRHSFTNALIEVLLDWRPRVFSAAMLHAEVLARLKHPRPIQINGKHFEARSTPVHFMMTANHKAPSIELSKLRPVDKTPAPLPHSHVPLPLTGRAAEAADPVSEGLASAEPNEDTPHVMISLALEDDQSLDIHAWEEWLRAFPAMARYVKVQGVFKSHSTLLLVSMPVMVWDMLPEDNATSFVAFIRSNNMVAQRREPPPTPPVPDPAASLVPPGASSVVSNPSRDVSAGTPFAAIANTTQSTSPSSRLASPGRPTTPPMSHLSWPITPVSPLVSPDDVVVQPASLLGPDSVTARQGIPNQQQSLRRSALVGDVPGPIKFSAHVEKRLEEYYKDEPLPTDARRALFASNLGIEPRHLEMWFHHRREGDMVCNRLAAIKPRDAAHEPRDSGPQIILPADLSRLLQISIPGQVMLFDLRSPTEYHRSHIHGAINLRAPQSFLRIASLDMICRAIADGQGRTTFSRWQSAKCIVFYGRGLDLPRDCPAASLVLDKLTESGWSGRCFILKGHYREFSQSFDTYIVGKSVTQSVQAWLDSQLRRSKSQTDIMTSQEQYAGWLSHLDAEGRARPVVTRPAQTSERLAAMEAQEEELEHELKARCGALYRKAQDVRMSQDDATHDDSPDAKADMVEYLDRGLAKIRDMQATPRPPSPAAYAPGQAKMAAEGYPEPPRRPGEDADEYVEVSKVDDASAAAPAETRRPGEEATPGRGRGGASLLNKMLRR